MNNVGALALMLPVALRNAYRDGYPPAKSLMPLAFASLLGGLTTLIGTPPNIIIASFRARQVGEPFGMFDFTPVGVAVAIAGLVFLVLIGWRLLPIERTQRRGGEGVRDRGLHHRGEGARRTPRRSASPSSSSRRWPRRSHRGRPDPQRGPPPGADRLCAHSGRRHAGAARRCRCARIGDRRGRVGARRRPGQDPREVLQSKDVDVGRSGGQPALDADRAHTDLAAAAPHSRRQSAGAGAARPPHPRTPEQCQLSLRRRPAAAGPVRAHGGHPGDAAMPAARRASARHRPAAPADARRRLVRAWRLRW